MPTKTNTRPMALDVAQALQAILVIPFLVCLIGSIWWGWSWWSVTTCAAGLFVCGAVEGLYAEDE